MLGDAPSLHSETNCFIRSLLIIWIQVFTKYTLNSPAFRDTPFGAASCSNFVRTGLSTYLFGNVERIQPFYFFWIVEPSINTQKNFEVEKLLTIFYKITSPWDKIDSFLFTFVNLQCLFLYLNYLLWTPGHIDQ